MIEQLALDLRAREFDVQILTFGQDYRSDQAIYRAETGVYRAKGKIDFLKLIKKIAPKFDVIYTFDLYTAGFLSWLIGKKIYRKKLVVRFAGDSAWELASNNGQTNDDIITFQNKFYGLSVAWHKLLRKFILLGADRVVAVSKFMQKIAIGIGVPEEKIKVIYNSVDFVPDNNPSDSMSLLQDRYKLNHCKVILTIGRLVPWKGIDILIKTLTKINDKELKLLIVGDGPDLGRLEKIVEDEHVAGQVEFVGKVPLAEVFRYYLLADVFVLDSQYEGLSHVLLEALAAGRPIVASDAGGNGEVIENEKNGLLIKYDDVDELASAIKKTLTEEKWHTPEFKNVCAESLKKFNWETNVNKTADLFNKILND